MFADQGIADALIQRTTLEKEHIDAAYWFNAGCAVLLCAGTIVLAGPISRLLGDPRAIPVLRWLSLALIFNAASSVHSTLFIKNMDFRRPTMRTLIANIAAGATGVAMAIGGYGVWALVGQQLSGSVAGAVFLWTASPYRPSFRLSFRHLRELLGISSSVFATSILWFFSSRLDQMVIGRFAWVQTLGLYVVAGKIPEFAKMITHTPLAEVSLPALSQLQNDYRRLRAAIYKGMELNAVFSFAVFIGLAVVASDLVPFLFGDKWAGASDLCALLSLYALVVILTVFFHPALLASGGAGKYVLVNVWHALGVVVACVVGIQFGTVYVVL